MTAEEYRKFSVATGRLAASRLNAELSSQQINHPKLEDRKAIQETFEAAHREVRDRMFPK